MKVFDGGFTSIIDLAFGQMGDFTSWSSTRGWAAVEIFGMPTGGTINACDLTSASCVVVASGIPAPTAISFGKAARAGRRAARSRQAARKCSPLGRRVDYPVGAVISVP